MPPMIGPSRGRDQARLDQEQLLSELHRLGVLDQDLGRRGRSTSDSISFMSFIASMMQTVCPTSTRVPDLDVRIGVRRRGAVERPHHRRGDRDVGVGAGARPRPAR